MLLKQKKDINKLLENAWLGISVDPEKLFNPLTHIPEELKEEPHLYVSWLMTKPEYFSFFCSEILNIKLLPMQAVIIRELWNRRFPILVGSRGFGKSFLLALYALLRMLFIPRRRLIICGSGFRQSKIVFNYMEEIWRNAPLLRDMIGTQNNGPRHEPDMWRFHIGEGVTIAIPIGDGSRIRGMRANDIIMDEFAAVSRDIFENVIAGFAAVRSSPALAVQQKAKQELAKKLGVKLETLIDEDLRSNQIIISGTAYYDFNHFADYWKRAKAIIHSGGKKERLDEIFKGETPDDFDWRDYSIIRIPYELIPRGFMEEGIVARSKATVHTGIYEMEFGAVFSTDSNGFFKRSLIESCVVSDQNEITLQSGKIDFIPLLYGNPSMKYVYGIDPASEIDNFSIAVLEIHPDHRRIVYVWTTNRKEFKERIKTGIISETDYYGYCARKIRELMKRFPCARMAMDSQGGGIAVYEALHDSDKLREGELPIWEIIDPEKEKDTDGNPGLHILEFVKFASSDWTSEANHGLRTDFEHKICLFPRFDSATIGLASLSDNYSERLYDTLEDCFMEIEELKNELSTIIITQTNSGRDRWDTPEVKLPGNKKGRLRKDRYSALLMANMSARVMAATPERPNITTIGGFAIVGQKLKAEGPDYVGPAWFTNAVKGAYDYF